MVLKRNFKNKKARGSVKKTKKAVQAIALARQSATANSEQVSNGKNFASGIAAGAGAGAVAVLAAYIALRACQRKKNDGDNFERLIQ